MNMVLTLLARLAGLAALMLAITAAPIMARQPDSNKPSRERPATSADAPQAIRAVLDAQVAAWNRGDIPGYMQGYWRSPELSFYSGGTVTSGWDATLARYQRRYQGEGRAMGTLDFSNLETRPVGQDSAWVGGRWHLKMPDGKDLGGLFTLIFRKMPEGWRIVHDHTSSE